MNKTVCFLPEDCYFLAAASRTFFKLFGFVWIAALVSIQKAAAIFLSLDFSS